LKTDVSSLTELLNLMFYK